MKTFKDRVVVVTGGASGVGKALAKAFLADGAKVVLSDVEVPALEKTCAELADHGMGPADIAANINFFMHVPVGADGEMDMGPSISKPGDHVDLRAETDVLAVISNCPQINNPVNDYNPTPVRAIVWDGR